MKGLAGVPHISRKGVSFDALSMSNLEASDTNLTFHLMYGKDVIGTRNRNNQRLNILGLPVWIEIVLICLRHNDEIIQI